LKLSTRARYALRMMMDVARQGGEQHPVNLTGVAERCGLSHGYLEQLALALRAGQLLRAVSGRGGGYFLARRASEITIGHIVEATIGPISIVPCIDDPVSCDRNEGCECRLVYTLINHRIGEVLHAYTLADLLDSGWVSAFKKKVDGLSQLPIHSRPFPVAETSHHSSKANRR
jgi:Rrf2 family protein